MCLQHILSSATSLLLFKSTSRFSGLTDCTHCLLSDLRSENALLNNIVMSMSSKMDKTKIHWAIIVQTRHILFETTFKNMGIHLFIVFF